MQARCDDTLCMSFGTFTTVSLVAAKPYHLYCPNLLKPIVAQV